MDGRKFIHAGIRVNEMKLLLGNPGIPDAAITPDRVLEIDQDFMDFQLNDMLKLFATNEVLCPLVRLYNLTGIAVRALVYGLWVTPRDGAV